VPRPAAIRLGLWFATTAVAAVGVVLVTRRPATDRDWAVDQSRLSEVTFDGPRVHVANVRTFRYRSEMDFEPGWSERTWDLRQVATAWLVLAPFSRAWRGPAHAFVSFGFDDSTYLAISIEARRERDEHYGLLRGLAREFELMYLVGDERDLIGRRALGEFDVYLYPIRAPRDRIRKVLIDMLERAERLRLHPEFYNTLTDNCTSNLVRHVNRVVPGRIPLGPRLLFPGYVDEVAAGLGLVDGASALSAVRARYRITGRARAALDDPAFSRLIRAGLPAAGPNAVEPGPAASPPAGQR